MHGCTFRNPYGDEYTAQETQTIGDCEARCGLASGCNVYVYFAGKCIFVPNKEDFCDWQWFVCEDGLVCTTMTHQVPARSYDGYGQSHAPCCAWVSLRAWAEGRAPAG